MGQMAQYMTLIGILELTFHTISQKTVLVIPDGYIGLAVDETTVVHIFPIRREVQNGLGIGFPLPFVYVLTAQVPKMAIIKLFLIFRHRSSPSQTIY